MKRHDKNEDENKDENQRFHSCSETKLVTNKPILKCNLKTKGSVGSSQALSKMNENFGSCFFFVFVMAHELVIKQKPVS